MKAIMVAVLYAPFLLLFTFFCVFFFFFFAIIIDTYEYWCNILVYIQPNIHRPPYFLSYMINLLAHSEN